MTELDPDWITEAHSQTLIEMALGVSEERSHQLLSDALESGLVTTKHPLDGLSTEGLSAVDLEYDPVFGRGATRYLLDDVRNLIESVSAPAEIVAATKNLVKKLNTKTEVENAWKQYVDTFAPPSKPTKQERHTWGQKHGLVSRRVDELSADHVLTPDYWRKPGRPPK